MLAVAGDDGAKGDRPTISPEHLAMLAESGITAEFAMARGYETITDKRRLASLKITPAGHHVPGLLVPGHRKDGSIAGYQYRPDNRRVKDGKPVKYESPYRQHNYIDVPPESGRNSMTRRSR